MRFSISVTGKRWLSRKVAGSIPDLVFDIFHWRNPSGCTMAQNNEDEEYFIAGGGGGGGEGGGGGGGRGWSVWVWC